MKKTLILCMACTCGMAHAANWVPMPSPAGLASYIDSSSITEVPSAKERMLMIWTRFVHAKVQKDKFFGDYVEEKVRYLIDCKTHQLATLQYQPYRADGSIAAYMPPVPEQKAMSQLQSPIPDSIAVSLVSTACVK